MDRGGAEDDQTINTDLGGTEFTFQNTTYHMLDIKGCTEAAGGGQ